jgi:virginiamycin B lyase
MGIFRRILLGTIYFLISAATLWAGSAAAKPVGEVENVDVHCEVRGIVAGPDGNVWFTCERDDRPPHFVPESLVGRVTPQGEVREFSQGLSPLSFLPEIIVGSDGNLWFPIEPGLNQFPPKAALAGIGRVTPQGQITEFRAGLSGKGVGGLTAGPDGNLWFGDDAATIGRVTPAGAITEFDSPTHSGSLSRPVTGSDGNLWIFAGASGHPALARVTPLGAISEFPTPELAGKGLGPLTLGPDGDLWFAERSQIQPGLGRITPSGQTADFNKCLHGGIPGAGPEYLAAGPDGNVWFTNVSARSLPSIVIPAGIGWITPSGKITELRGGLSAEPGAIVAGADGSMWFADGDAIGRIRPFSAPANTFLVGRHPGLIRRSGSSALAITVPGPGTLRLRPLALLLPHKRKLKLPAAGSIRATAASCGPTILRVTPKGPARTRLLREGRVTLRVKVSFTPTGGTTNTSEATIVLRKRSR